MQANTLERLITLTEVARRLNVSLGTARKVRTQLRPVRIGKAIRYPESELAAFIQRGGFRMVGILGDEAPAQMVHTVSKFS